MLTTSQLRTEWAPACPSGDLTRVSLHGDGIVSVRRAVVPAVQALDACLTAANYRTRRADTGAYNCRRITGGTGYSLHAYGIAIDINWQTNPYSTTLRTDMPSGMVRSIKAIRTRNGAQVWGWGGDYRVHKDAMHYEIVCRRADLATGIDPATLPGGTPATPPTSGDISMSDAASIEAKLDRVLASLTRVEAELRITKGEAAAAGLRAQALQEDIDKLATRLP